METGNRKWKLEMELEQKQKCNLLAVVVVENFVCSSEITLMVRLQLVSCQDPLTFKLDQIGPSLIAGLDWWTGLLDWINQTASKSDDACVAH